MNMKSAIIPIRLKFTRCYLIQGSVNGQTAYVMVDAGPPKCDRIFKKEMDKLSLDPSRIKLVFITHGHWDHWGSLHQIVEMTGAECAINYREAPWMEDNRVRVPPGVGAWGKFTYVLLALMKPGIRRGLAKITADHSLPDEGLSLEPYGIKGRILHTPGHTEGSMSLLLDSGEAFVGDLAMSGFPRIGEPGPFVLGEDINTMKRSWQILLDAGAVKIFPSHGEPFSARVFDEYYASRS
jgi:glyoxylase-like metal-dependent hydrolase (beta-lactamase superfamily II)